MKVKNLNNSSLKTKNTIKKVFAEMLSEKRELNKITITELTKRANISRATFYSHYDDVYAVAEDCEKELIDRFFTNDKLSNLHDYRKFTDEFFDYIIKNQENYMLICRSHSITTTASRISNLAKNKFLEICYSNPKVINKQNIEVEISVIFDGIFCQYIKYCRQVSNVTPEQLHAFCIKWGDDFYARRMKKD